MSKKYSTSTISLNIPICEKCLSKIDKQPEKISDSNTSIITTPYFTREIKQGYIIFTFTNTNYTDQFREINQGLVFSSIDEGTSQQTRLQVSPIVIDKNKSIQENFKILLEGILPNMPDRNWYRQPMIPKKKLTNAIAAYANSITPEQVIGLADGSAMGSAKDGCILTSEGIYFKTTGNKGEFSWKEIQRAQPTGGFPSYILELILTSGLKSSIECSCFEEIRPVLGEFITQMAILNHVD